MDSRFKCQIAKILWGFAANPRGPLDQVLKPPAPKLRNSQFVSNGPNQTFLAHTLTFQLTCRDGLLHKEYLAPSENFM